MPEPTKALKIQTVTTVQRVVQQLIKRPSRKHEAELWVLGYELVAGVDEVGRGSWAGPVAAAAVVLPKECRIKGVRDSKLLTKLQRQQLAKTIRQKAISVGIGWSPHYEVDHYGLTWAVRQSGLRALDELEHFDMVLLDGNHNYLREDYPAKAIIKADRCCLSVAAASVVAKDARDRYMAAMHRLYPEYGFDSNMGYGSLAHRLGLRRALSPIHRRRYAPIKAAGGYGN